MTAASDVAYGRGALAAIRRARAAHPAWPTADTLEDPYRCRTCDRGPVSVDGRSWCTNHRPICDTCRTATTSLTRLGRGRHCQACLPAVNAGLTRMAAARRAAGQPLTPTDIDALR